MATPAPFRHPARAPAVPFRAPIRSILLLAAFAAAAPAAGQEPITRVPFPRDTATRQPAPQQPPANEPQPVTQEPEPPAQEPRQNPQEPQPRQEPPREPAQPPDTPRERPRFPPVPVVVPVPDLIGLDVASARRRLLASGLTVGEVDSLAVEGRQRGIVVRQGPGAGTSVVRGYPVRMTFSARPTSASPPAGQAELVTVPDLRGRPLADAREVIGGAGLRLAGTDPLASARPEGTVLMQEPAPGARVPPGSGVRLMVAQAALVMVPDVVGARVDRARARAEAAGLQLRAGGDGAGSDAAVVQSQRPQAGSRAARGSVLAVAAQLPVAGGPAQPRAVEPVSDGPPAGEPASEGPSVAQPAVEEPATAGGTQSVPPPVEPPARERPSFDPRPPAATPAAPRPEAESGPVRWPWLALLLAALAAAGALARRQWRRTRPARALSPGEAAEELGRLGFRAAGTARRAGPLAASPGPQATFEFGTRTRVSAARTGAAALDDAAVTEEMLA